MKKSLQLLVLLFAFVIPSVAFAANTTTSTDPTDFTTTSKSSADSTASTDPTDTLDTTEEDTTMDNTESTTTNVVDDLVVEDTTTTDTNDVAEKEETTTSNYMDYLPYALIAGSVILLISIIGILLSKKKDGTEIAQDTPVTTSNPTLEPPTNLENIPANLQNETKTDNVSQPKPTLAEMVNQPKQSMDGVQQTISNPLSEPNTMPTQQSSQSKDLEDLNNSNQDIKDMIQDNATPPVETASTNIWSAPETKPFEQPAYTPTENSSTPTEVINSNPVSTTPISNSYASELPTAPTTQDVNTTSEVPNYAPLNTQNESIEQSNPVNDISGINSMPTQPVTPQEPIENNYPPVPNTNSSLSQIMPESPSIDLQGLVNKEIEEIKTVPEQTNTVQTPLNPVVDSTKSEDLPPVPPMM